MERLFDFWERQESVSVDVLLQNAPFYCHCINSDGLLVLVSTSWATRLKYDPQEMLHRPSTDFLTAESRDKAVNEVLPRFFATCTMRNVRYTFIASDEERVPVLMSATAIKRNGKFHSSFAVIFEMDTDSPREIY